MTPEWRAHLHAHVVFHLQRFHYGVISIIWASQNCAHERAIFSRFISVWVSQLFKVTDLTLAVDDKIYLLVLGPVGD